MYIYNILSYIYDLRTLFGTLCRVFLIMTPCNVVGGNQRSWGNHHLCFHGSSVETLFGMVNRPNITKEKWFLPLRYCKKCCTSTYKPLELKLCQVIYNFGYFTFKQIILPITGKRVYCNGAAFLTYTTLALITSIVLHRIELATDAHLFSSRVKSIRLHIKFYA